MSDAIGAHMPEPRPETRSAARFVNEVEPSPKARRHGGSAGKFNKGLPQCGFCKRRDGSHSPKCPRKAGGHSRVPGPKRQPVTRKTGPAADAAAAATVLGKLQSQQASRGDAMLRARLEDELAEAEAYAASIRVALGRL